MTVIPVILPQLITLENVVSFLGSLYSIYQILLALKVYRFILKYKQISRNISLQELLAAAISLALWLRYGYLVNDRALIFFNEIGFVSLVITIAVFCWYSEKKMTVLSQITIGLSLLIGIMVYSFKYHLKLRYTTWLSVTQNIALLIFAMMIIVLILDPLTTFDTFMSSLGLFLSIALIAASVLIPLFLYMILVKGYTDEMLYILIITIPIIVYITFNIRWQIYKYIW